jgi:AhpC/TSA family
MDSGEVREMVAMIGRRVVGLVLAVVGLALVASVPAPLRAADLTVETLDGQRVEPLRFAAGAKAAVFVFVSTECPVSNRYAPEVLRLYDQLAAKGIRFTLVYPNPSESAADIRAHLKAYGYPMDALRDPAHAFVKSIGITITPEAAVFTPDGTLAYRGRLDDRYVSLGLERPAPTRRDLADALTDLLAGRSVRTPRTQAVGCYVADFAR